MIVATLLTDDAIDVITVFVALFVITQIDYFFFTEQLVNSKDTKNKTINLELLTV